MLAVGALPVRKNISFNSGPQTAPGLGVPTLRSEPTPLPIERSKPSVRFLISPPSAGITQMSVFLPEKSGRSWPRTAIDKPSDEGERPEMTCLPSVSFRGSPPFAETW